MNDYLPYIQRNEADTPIKWGTFPTGKCREFLTVIFHVLDDPFKENAEKENQWVVSIIVKNKEKELLLMLDAASLEDDMDWLICAPADQLEHLIHKPEAPSVSVRNSYIEIIRENNKINLSMNKYEEASGKFESITLNDVRPNRDGDSLEVFIIKSCQELIDHGNAIYGRMNNNSPER